MDMHTTLNGEITRTGQHYPPVKLLALSFLQEDSRRNAPYSLCTVPYSHARWDFEYPSLCNAMLHIGTKPVAIRLACILNGKVHLPNKMPGYVDVIPLYVNDAAKADNIMADPTGFHPGFDLGVYSERTYHPIRVRFRRREVAVPGKYYTTHMPKYIVDVFDNTKMRFDDDSNLIHPNLLKANDLVVMECHMHLDADPQSSSPPSMYLVTYEIRLVHLASEASNVRLVCVE